MVQCCLGWSNSAKSQQGQHYSTQVSYASRIYIQMVWKAKHWSKHIESIYSNLFIHIPNYSLAVFHFYMFDFFHFSYNIPWIGSLYFIFKNSSKFLNLNIYLYYLREDPSYFFSLKCCPPLSPLWRSYDMNIAPFYISHKSLIFNFLILFSVLLGIFL